MEIQVRVPSHVCPHCGEWWIVEPLAENRWAVVRYGDDTVSWDEAEVLPVCPECVQTALEQWLISD